MLSVVYFKINSTIVASMILYYPGISYLLLIKIQQVNDKV